jgi:ABC-type transporter Mla maintaining outer membrane lipid asymmetry permease subunit MlaE
MAVSEQTDSLRVLGSDPVDYLITPRTLACMIAGPILNLMCFVMGGLIHAEGLAIQASGLACMKRTAFIHSIGTTGVQIRNLLQRLPDEQDGHSTSHWHVPPPSDVHLKSWIVLQA